MLTERTLTLYQGLQIAFIEMQPLCLATLSDQALPHFLPLSTYERRCPKLSHLVQGRAVVTGTV